MATERPEISLPSVVGSATVRVDRVYGNLVIYPVDYNAFRFAELTGKKTLDLGDLANIRLLGFEVSFAAGSAVFLNGKLNELLASEGFRASKAARTIVVKTRNVNVGIDGSLSRVRWDVIDEASMEKLATGIAHDEIAALMAAKKAIDCI